MNSFILDGVFYYIDGLQILKGCFFKAEAGKLTSLFGINGSGKSTLLKIGAGQLQPDSGLTMINGKKYHKRSKRNRFKEIGYLPQDTFIPKGLSVSKLLSNNYNSIKGSDSILKNIWNSKVGKLSLGERRYIEVLFILSFERSFLIFDEPFTGLSPIMIETLVKRLKDKAKLGTGIILTDHYSHYIKEVSDELYLVSNGETKRA